MVERLGFLRQLKSAASASLLLLATTQGLALSSDLSTTEEVIVPKCVKNLSTTIANLRMRQNWLNSHPTLCPNESGQWIIQLHELQFGNNLLTSGKALILLYFDDPVLKQIQGTLPHAVVLQPVSDQVWLFAQLINGKVEKWGKDIFYYAWAPSNSLQLSQKTGIPDWGDQDLRMFRCVSDSGISCVTYYDLRKCSLDDMNNNRGNGAKPDKQTDIIISASKKSSTETPEIVGDFEPVDLLIRQLAIELADIRCASELE